MVAHGESFVRDGVEDVVFCNLRFPSGRVAHMHLSWLDPHKERRFTLVGSQRMATFDDMALERKVTVYDKGFDPDFRNYGEYITRSGDVMSPQISNEEPLRIECRHFVDCAAQRAPSRARARAAACGPCACSRRFSARSRPAAWPSGWSSRARAATREALRASFRPCARADARARGASSAPTSSSAAGVVIHSGTVVGDGCEIQDGAVLGKRPRLGRLSTRQRDGRWSR